jgi:hypothetical protein
MTVRPRLGERCRSCGAEVQTGGVVKHSTLCARWRDLCACGHERSCHRDQIGLLDFPGGSCDWCGCDAFEIFRKAGK